MTKRKRLALKLCEESNKLLPKGMSVEVAEWGREYRQTILLIQQRGFEDGILYMKRYTLEKLESISAKGLASYIADTDFNAETDQWFEHWHKKAMGCHLKRTLQKSK